MNTVTDTCPSLEDIAAFLDGKLSEEERARVIAHLADCESCYSVFAGAARFQLEEEEEEFQEPAVAVAAESAVIPFLFLKKRIARWALPLAALLVLGLATVPLYLQASQMPEIVSAELVDPGWEGQPWSEGDTRGDRDLGEAYDAYEFLVGGQLVDLHLTLTRNDDPQMVLDVLSRINKHINNFIVAPEEARFYEQAREHILAGKPPTDLSEDAARQEASLTESMEEVDSAYLAFGKWTEAGRLASLAHQSAFFEEGDNRRFLGWLIRNEEEQNLDKEVVRVLKEIRGVLENGDPQKLRYDPLKERFEAILRHYENEARAGSSL
ncbi:MAG TPA: zf-HC2 domain-containing protein [Thermoanaerobaculia bacterium]|nr:zf-HC2 domain-containing protein [Thermoanaerobaculia bacterium]